jgi:LacI family transcriptional regulator
MVAALIALGHQRIAFLAGPSSLFVARARLAGYRRGLEEAGLAFDQRLVVHTSFDREGGGLGVETLLAGDAPFTAIACANDPLAMGALARLAELGIDVPGAVSVAGFDDVPVAAITSPSLSTVRLPLREMGRLGFIEAARVLDGGELTATVLPTELAMRGSTATPAAVALGTRLEGVGA